MSEELRQKGYLDKRGRSRGEPVGSYEGFNIGATTLDQLRRASIIPDRDYGRFKKNKPDGIVVDRRASTPEVKFLIEFKDKGGLDSESRTRDFIDKIAEEYCRPLLCPVGGVSDYRRTSWVFVTDQNWEIIRREDDYPLDAKIDLSSPIGRDLIGRTLFRIETELNKQKAILIPQEAVNPTRLAEQTWQTIWLASGEKPEQCLATFIEILVFKFISDLGILKTTSSGVPVDFGTLRQMEGEKILKYYFENVRPQIKKLFPFGTDGTSVINGIVFDPNNKDHGWLFLQILNNFEAFGPLRKIHPEFKSRIFERFLKKNQIVRYWGQHFTPRNVVKAMVEMSGIEYLSPRATVADPACGVGGFVLEPLVYKRPYDFRVGGESALQYVGWDRDEKIIILAKANMLVYLSEVFEKDPKAAVEYIAPILNSTFTCTGNAITGSLAMAPIESFDLVLTNPPYVVKGTGIQRNALRQNKRLEDYYSVSGAGIENLFVQLIINGLKKGGRALVIVPDGLLLRHSERSLRAHILKTCQLEAIISLPKDTFYSTPKKTYILVLRKKQDERDKQRNPVFTYLVSNIGETLDARRFTVEDNDLPSTAASFRLFQGNPLVFKSQDPRLKVWPIERFKPEEHWMVEKWWTREERETLKDIDEETFIGATELSLKLEETSDLLADLARSLKIPESPKDIHHNITVSLGDTALFRMSIGKRVLKRELFYAEAGHIPLYSANVERGHEHGWVKQSNLADLSKPSLLWSIDSDFNMTVREPSEEFATTDHCGRVEILHPDLDSAYCRAAITYGFGRIFGFDRVHRPSLERMRKMTFRVPVKKDGLFDLDAQRSLAREFDLILETVKQTEERLKALIDLKPKIDLSEID